MKRKRRSIRSNLCLLALGPLFCVGAATLLIASAGIYKAMAAETKDGLKNLAFALYRVYELEEKRNPGLLHNSGRKSEDDFEIVDHIKNVSGVDATIFYGDTRLLTSVRNPDGSRAVGTQAAPEVSRAVLVDGKDYFSQNVWVNNTLYFGYYMPISSDSGKIVGMVFVGKTRKIVMDAVVHTVFGIFLSVAVVGVLSAAGAMLYARKIVYSLDKTKEFLGGIAMGNVEENIDPCILKRNDEIGEMGNFAVILKTSINELVSTDPLTGLYNRRSCEVIIKNIVREYEKYKTPSVVAMGDIDFFKKVNDTYGHQGGDAVLKGLAAIFREHMERKGVVARWGGEEFMFIYERMDMERVRAHLEELREKVCSTEFSYDGASISITMTFGVCACMDGAGLEELTKQADDNLYYGKKNGRNQVVVSQTDLI